MTNKRTSLKVSREAFKCWYSSVMQHKTHSEQMVELLLVFSNNDYKFYNHFMRNKRIKAHTAAFYSVILSVSYYLDEGFYISNEDIKKLILEFFNCDYKEFLKDLVEMIEEERENHLSEVK